MKASTPKIEFKVVDKVEFDKKEVAATPQKDEPAKEKTEKKVVGR